MDKITRTERIGLNINFAFVGEKQVTAHVFRDEFQVPGARSARKVTT